MAQQEHRSSSVTLPGPLRNAASALRKVPGADVVSRAAEQALDGVGAVSPRGRRLAVYAGAGVLGVAGVVEWPVAVTGAAVAWLTRPRPEERERERRRDGEEQEGRGNGGGVIAPGDEGAVPVDGEGRSSPGGEPSAGASPPVAAGTPSSDPAITTTAASGVSAAADPATTPSAAPDPVVLTPAASDVSAPPRPGGDTQATESGKPAPDVLGGGGPLTDEDASPAPTGRTTG